MAVMQSDPRRGEPNESICRHCGQPVWRTGYGVWCLSFNVGAPGFCWGGPPAKHEPIPDAELVLVP